MKERSFSNILFVDKCLLVIYYAPHIGVRPLSMMVKVTLALGICRNWRISKVVMQEIPRYESFGSLLSNLSVALGYELLGFVDLYRPVSSAQFHVFFMKLATL